VQCSANVGVLSDEAPVIGNKTKETLDVTFTEEKVSVKIQVLESWGGGEVAELGICKISKTNTLISRSENARHPTASTCCLSCADVIGKC
jgi:hypothetical protein